MCVCVCVCVCVGGGVRVCVCVWRGMRRGVLVGGCVCLGGGGRCTDAPANSIFSCPVTSVFSAMRFNEESFTRQCEVKEKDPKEGLRV